MEASSSSQSDAMPGSSSRVPAQSQYTNYDSIQDVPGSPDARPRARFSVGDAALFTGSIIFSLLGGFGLYLRISDKKYRKALAINNSSTKHELPKHMNSGAKVVLEDPVALATRALGWGTLFAVLGSGAVGLVTTYILKRYSLLDKSYQTQRRCDRMQDRKQ